MSRQLGNLTGMAYFSTQESLVKCERFPKSDLKSASWSWEPLGLVGLTSGAHNSPDASTTSEPHWKLFAFLQSPMGQANDIFIWLSDRVMNSVAEVYFCLLEIKRHLNSSVILWDLWRNPKGFYFAML
ncbi:hypothetical protein CRG98_040536 [Punica granatum]|uniref:Uncharacterized protein n=1 Tax=Punica granatum TaxID=22663 RepID=A0A2I0I527_PUNGR|nr:hypothetical protein CRG98_040536 [Punica granatum]